MLPGIGTLQAALSAASAGDELILADGTYTGDVLQIDKNILIRAMNPSRVVLDGQNTQRVISITGGGDVVLDGLNITNGFSAGDGAGLFISSTTVVVLVTKCNIYNNLAQGEGGGAYINGGLSPRSISANGADVTFSACTIHHNTASTTSSALGGGGLLFDGGSLKIISCTI